MSNIKCLQTPEDCIDLLDTLNLNKSIIAVYATGLPRQTVDVMLYLRDGLLEFNYQVIFLLKESGLKYFDEIIGSRSMENVYCCENASLLEYCDYIDVLFAIDTIIMASVAQKFKGKIVFSPHTFFIKMPTGNGYGFWVDYYLMPVRDYFVPKFNYKLYPNYIKRSRPSNFTLITGGYLKIDLGYERFLQENLVPRKRKRVVYFPRLDYWSFTCISKHYSRFIEEEEQFIASFFEMYPDYEFVLRPMSEDLNIPRYVRLRNQFSNNAQFIFDDSADNLKYLITADVLLTGASGAKENYAYTTLLPYISINPLASEDIVKVELGYETNSFTHVCQLISSVFENRKSWQETIKANRSEVLPLFGRFRDYLCLNMENIIHNTPQQEWIVLDKYYEPDSVKNILKCFNKKIFLSNSGQLMYILGDVYWYIQARFPENIPIGFSILKFGLEIYNRLGFEFWMQYIKPHLKQTSYLPQDKLLKFLNYSIKKNPNNHAAKYYLATTWLQFSLYSKLKYEASYFPDYLKDTFSPLETCLLKYASAEVYNLKRKIENPACSLWVEGCKLHFNNVKHLYQFLEFLDAHKDEVRLNQPNIWDAYIIQYAPSIFKLVAKLLGQKKTALYLLHLRKLKYTLFS